MAPRCQTPDPQARDHARRPAAVGRGDRGLARAELVIPYALLRPPRNVPPTKGSRWRANFYRIDHDTGNVISWDWSRVGPSFHKFENFGTIMFD
jgi:hypothetical protein